MYKWTMFANIDGEDERHTGLASTKKAAEAAMKKKMDEKDAEGYLIRKATVSKI